MTSFQDMSRYQKGILIVTVVMAILFTVAYCTITARVGLDYRDAILVPEKENGVVTYSGQISRQPAVITVADSVTFRIGEKTYGPYTAKEDPTAAPTDKGSLTGVEITSPDGIFFRGGVSRSGETLLIFHEDGSFAGLTVTAEVGGTLIDENGNPVDPMAPSAYDILELLDGPVLTHKGQWVFWVLGMIVSVATVIFVFFADALFRLRLSFRIQNAYEAEPSDWELTGRKIGLALLLVTALVIFITGLQ